MWGQGCVARASHRAVGWGLGAEAAVALTKAARRESVMEASPQPACRQAVSVRKQGSTLKELMRVQGADGTVQVWEQECL